MSLWNDLKQKAIDANPELAAKATQALSKAKDLAVEAGHKAAPVLKEATEKGRRLCPGKDPDRQGASPQGHRRCQDSPGRTATAGEKRQGGAG